MIKINNFKKANISKVIGGYHESALNREGQSSVDFSYFTDEDLTRRQKDIKKEIYQYVRNAESIKDLENEYFDVENEFHRREFYVGRCFE